MYCYCCKQLILIFNEPHIYFFCFSFFLTTACVSYSAHFLDTKTSLQYLIQSDFLVTYSLSFYLCENRIRVCKLFKCLENVIPLSYSFLCLCSIVCHSRGIWDMAFQDTQSSKWSFCLWWLPAFSIEVSRPVWYPHVIRILLNELFLQCNEMAPENVVKALLSLIS